VVRKGRYGASVTAISKDTTADRSSFGLPSFVLAEHAFIPVVPYMIIPTCQPESGKLPFPLLRAQRVVLRQLRGEDAGALVEIFSHPEVLRYWGGAALLSELAAREFIGSADGLRAQNVLHVWGIARADDDRILGTATLAQVDIRNKRAEVGYALGRDHWGRGYMAEALPVLIRHAFDTLELHRLEADVDPRNGPSVRILERLGFQREGFLRERWVINGEIQDSLMFGLLRPDWQLRAGG